MLDVIFRWKCDICGATHVESRGDFTDAHDGIGAHLGVGHAVTMKSLPFGWSCVNNNLVCPLHKIIIRPLDGDGAIGFARDIYDGVYGGQVPVPMPDDLTPECFKKEKTNGVD